MPPRPDCPPPHTIRAFVAANLDSGLKEALARIMERLRSTRADVGWVRPENLHLTLKFLGRVEQTRLLAIAEVIGSVARRSAPFRLVVGGLGAFPSPRAARVVWVGVPEGADSLAGLQARLEAELEPLGFAREERAFTAHLTLGRVRGPGHREQLAAALISMPPELLGEMVLDRIELMKSDPRPGGARYSIVHSFLLGVLP
ncbi:MAG: RNA 2',3'-cyclic phosphodiesterase [Candidatus Methylomirabilis oxyfera]|nr:RNA 2',3'-cyclic phosphodiesterase [Candidatus Methylomirabilis oxyfera]